MALTYLSGERIQGIAGSSGTTTETGATGDSNADTSYVVHKYISGLTEDDVISKVTIDIYNMSGNLKAAVYTTTGSGTSTSPDQKLAETGAVAVSVSNTYTTVTFDLTSTCTVPANGIVWVGWFPDGNYKFRSTGGSGLYTSSKHGSGVSGASYSAAMPTTAWVKSSGDMGNGGNNLRAGVVTGVLAEDKATITNVSAGTRYEETDTLKIFTRTGGAGAGWAEKGSSFADRLRGCWAGGYGSSSAVNTIDYVVISTLGNATDFGNMTRTNSDLAGCSNDTRGLWCCGGNSTTDTIDYITVATLGNATDFGNASASKSGVAALADATRACVAGGNTGSKIDVIDYFTIASPGNATDFGNLTEAREKPAGVADATRGCIGGGKNAAGSRVNTIDYITIQSIGNATDFGDLTQIREELGSCADATRACWAGGAASVYDIIDYVTIQTTGNATDFGNLLSATEILAGCADATRGIFGGGRVSGSNTNVIAYITIQSVGNATDFGDLTEARRGIASGVAA